MKRFLCSLILLYVFLFPVWVQADTKKIEGTTNVEDVDIGEGVVNQDKNFGNQVIAYVITYSGYNKHCLIRVKNVASELGVGATNITAVCSLYCPVNTTDDNISAYRVFKPWIEGDDGDPADNEVSWNDWVGPDYEWTTPGCGSADDEGVDNSGDGTGADRKATAEDIVNVTETGWYGWDISTELATGWYDGTIEEEGIILIGSIENGENRFLATEYTVENQPFFVFTYTTGEPPAAGQVIIIGAKDEENYHNPHFVCPDLGR